MRRSTFSFVLLFVASMLLLGCAGFSGPKTSFISGTVLDFDNNPVRDARVWTADSETYTSTSGAFVIESNRPGELTVNAQIYRNGVEYRGMNTALNFENEQTQSVNIVVGPASESATLHGQVKDRDGYLLENASVFAFNEAGSSIRVFTNADGNFTLRYLLPNVLYTISASGVAYRSDQADIVLDPQESRNMNFILGNPDVPVLDPPQNFWVDTWVSPTDATRAPGTVSSYDAVKESLSELLDEKRGVSKKSKGTKLSNTQPLDPGRGLRSDIIVEADLYWDWYIHPDILGYGIYRGNGNTNFLDFHYLSFDPMSGVFVDIGLNAGQTYTYGATTVATLYLDYPNTESGLSDLIVVETLDRLDLFSPWYGPLTFRWANGSRADEFAVFVFDEFPGVGVDWIWDSFSNPTSGTNYVYDGPSLQFGHTYYYLVLGTANGGASRTISQIDSFIG